MPKFCHIRFVVILIFIILQQNLLSSNVFQMFPILFLIPFLCFRELCAKI